MVQGNSHNIPQCNATTQPRDQQYAQPKKQEKEFCIIGGEDLSNRFLSNQQRKTERRGENGFCDPQLNRKGQNLDFV